MIKVAIVGGVSVGPTGGRGKGYKGKRFIMSVYFKLKRGLLTVEPYSRGDG